MPALPRRPGALRARSRIMDRSSDSGAPEDPSRGNRAGRCGFPGSDPHGSRCRGAAWAALTRRGAGGADAPPNLDRSSIADHTAMAAGFECVEAALAVSLAVAAKAGYEVMALSRGD